MTTPNLFTTPPDPARSEPAVEPATELVPAPRRGRYHRNAAVAAALVGLLAVAGLVVALLLPSGGPGQPDLPGAVDELVAGAGLPTVDGPEPNRGRDGGARAGAGGRGLGDDTLLVGRIVANNAGSLAVAQDGGQDRTVRTDGRTGVRGGDNRAVADLQPGERVLIRVDGTGAAAVAVTVVAPPARVLGTVTGLDGDIVTLVQVDGRTETVNVARLNPKPAVGELIVLVGTATDGATFTAERVRVLPKAS